MLTIREEIKGDSFYFLVFVECDIIQLSTYLCYN